MKLYWNCPSSGLHKSWNDSLSENRRRKKMTQRAMKGVEAILLDQNSLFNS